jgi:UDP:flavonoid glycosyltransferase YjiC (YdhE family)
MRVILAPVGSSGDVLPFVALGAELRQRGHDVFVVTSPYFRDAVEAEGLTLEPLGTVEHYLEVARNPQLWHPKHAFGVIAREVTGTLFREAYERIAALVLPGETVAAGSALAFGARVAQDRLGLPYATVHLQPSVLRSVIDMPTFGPPIPRIRWVRRAFFWIADAFYIDRFLRGPINTERRRLGLGPIRHVEAWWHSPQRVIGLFPEWFASHPPDWPPQVRLTGFPLADGRAAHPMPAELRRWLDAGEPPIVFSFGSAMMHANELFAAGAEACRRLGRRGLLLARFGEQIPAELPIGVAHFAYAPFGEVFPRAAALVHHGGIGTTAQALAAGRPQLIVPFAHDQPDNAERVRRLGAGASLKPRKADAAGLARKLAELLADERLAAGAAKCAERIQDPQRDVAAACDLIEELR